MDKEKVTKPPKDLYLTKRSVTKLRKEFAVFMSKLPEEDRKLIEATGLVPWEKYAFANRPNRSMYFRINQYSFCPHKHVHLKLDGFTYSGEWVCRIEPARSEDMVPYPYGTDSPPPKELIKLERDLVEGWKRNGTEGATELVLGIIELGDVLQQDDRRGKDRGH